MWASHLMRFVENYLFSTFIFLIYQQNFQSIFVCKYFLNVTIVYLRYFLGKSWRHFNMWFRNILVVEVLVFSSINFLIQRYTHVYIYWAKRCNIFSRLIAKMTSWNSRQKQTFPKQFPQEQTKFLRYWTVYYQMRHHDGGIG